MRAVVFGLLVIVAAPPDLLAWGAAHGVITEAALKLLPEWQLTFLGRKERESMIHEYCVYPDQYYGEKKAQIDPYIMPELRKAVMPLHLETPGTLETEILAFYVGKSLELLARPETRTDGIRFAGTFIHLLEDRTCPAHCLPTDNFFEGLAQFIPASASTNLWMHSQMESLGREYTGLTNYTPVLLGDDQVAILRGLTYRLKAAKQVIVPLIMPEAEAILSGNRARSIELQIEAAKESTKVVADFLYTVLTVSQGKADAADTAARYPAKDPDVMAYDYPLDTVVTFCRERFAWGSGYERITRAALQALNPEDRERLGTQAKRLASRHVFLPEGKAFAESKLARTLGGPAERYSGGSIHMPIDASDDTALFETLVREAHGAIRVGRLQEGCEYLGVAAHAAIDRHSPVDLHVRHAFCYRLQYLLPAPEGCDVWRKGPVLGHRGTVSLDGHVPERLGETPAEIAFRLQLRFRTRALPLARGKIIELLRARYRKDREEVLRNQSVLAEEAARTVADLMHSVLALSSTKAQPMTASQITVSMVAVPESTPALVPVTDAGSYEKNQYDHYWRLRWSRPYCQRLWKNEAGSLPTDPALIRPLELTEGGQSRVAPVGFIHGSGPVHDFAIPKGVYREFRTRIGCHPGLGNKDESASQFMVLLDGKRAYTSPVLKRGDESVEVSVLLGEARTLSLGSVPGKAGHLVWANPVLCR